MAKKLLLLYALFNACLYFALCLAEPINQASNLPQLLTDSVECLKGQEETLRTLLWENQKEIAQRKAIMAAVPWFILAVSVLVQMCWPRGPARPRGEHTEGEYRR